MQVLLTFTGFHDPFSPTVVEQGRKIGPVLSVMEARQYDCVILFNTPGTIENTKETVEEIKTRFPDVNTKVFCLEKLNDPTDHLGILSYLRKFLTDIRDEMSGADFTIALSSGTPAMHACWLLLVADGTFPARLISGHRPLYDGGEYRITEVDLENPSFPHVEARVCEEPADYFVETPDLKIACEQLGIVGEDKPFVDALKVAERLARYDAHALLLGETGTGKEHFARLIHYLSGDGNRPFVVTNCAAAPKDLVESMLFGHKKGAFTGAVSDRIGDFDAAEGGTLFLDEIGELPLESQSKLLRVLQDGIIKPLGSNKEHKVNVRVVAATNVDIPTAVKSGRFRLDLSKRFTIRISIPALRERRGDIIRLAAYTLDQWNRKYAENKKLSRGALEKLQQSGWSGNVRELISTVQTSAMLTPSKVIKAGDLRFEEPVWNETPDAVLPEPYEGFLMKEYLNDVRDRLLQKALKIAHGNRSQAGRLLGITPQAVHRFVKESEVITD